MSAVQEQERNDSGEWSGDELNRGQRESTDPWCAGVSLLLLVGGFGNVAGGHAADRCCSLSVAEKKQTGQAIFGLDGVVV
jgi:hypothetical protein